MKSEKFLLKYVMQFSKPTGAKEQKMSRIFVFT